MTVRVIHAHPMELVLMSSMVMCVSVVLDIQEVTVNLISTSAALLHALVMSHALKDQMRCTFVFVGMK
jgi:hypothetical protein